MSVLLFEPAGKLTLLIDVYEINHIRIAEMKTLLLDTIPTRINYCSIAMEMQ